MQFEQHKKWWHVRLICSNVNITELSAYWAPTYFRTKSNQLWLCARQARAVVSLPNFLTLSANWRTYGVAWDRWISAPMSHLDSALIDCLTLSVLDSAPTINRRNPFAILPPTKRCGGSCMRRSIFVRKLPSQSPSIVDAKALRDIASSICAFKWYLNRFFEISMSNNEVP